MYQSIRQHTAHARQRLGEEVVAVIPATTIRAFAAINMHVWRPALLIVWPDRIDVHLSRAIHTGPGERISTTPLGDVTFDLGGRRSHVDLSDATWFVGAWHRSDLQQAFALVGLTEPSESP